MKQVIKLAEKNSIEVRWCELKQYNLIVKKDK